MGQIIFVTGGVRSGKSRFAEQLAQEIGQGSVLYAATGVACDQEMDQRILLHKERRPSSWGLVEAPYDPMLIVPYMSKYQAVLFDCLSAWVSNRLLQASEMEESKAAAALIYRNLEEFMQQIDQDVSSSIIFVTNETGLGGVAMSPLGRWFQDVLGEVNQKVAAKADVAYAVWSGLPWRLKG